VGPLLTRRDLLLALCLAALLTGVYWLTYSGRFLSGDETAAQERQFQYPLRAN